MATPGRTDHFQHYSYAKLERLVLRGYLPPVAALQCEHMNTMYSSSSTNTTIQSTMQRQVYKMMSQIISQIEESTHSLATNCMSKLKFDYNFFLLTFENHFLVRNMPLCI